MSELRIRLIEKLCRLPETSLPQVEKYISELNPAPPMPVRATSSRETLDVSIKPTDWPHAPVHRLGESGTFIVTAATQYKKHFFRGEERLKLLHTTLLKLAKEYDVALEAWAVFSNHYHFVGYTIGATNRIRNLCSHLHTETASAINQLDHEPAREVWFNFWDTQLTFETSYLARLNYVHQNAARHQLVPVANQYPWCSAGWFERTATPAQVKTIYGFKTDTVTVQDEFNPAWP